MKLSFPKFQLALVLVLAAVSAGVVALTYWALTPSFYFEVSMRSSTRGMAQTFYDVGRGISEPDSVRLYLQHAKSTAVYRFPLPQAEYRTIRFDPLDHGNAHIVINSTRIVDMFGHTVRKFSVGELRVANGISASEIKDGRMSLTLGPADNDSNLIINPGTPLALHMAPSARLLSAASILLLCFLPLVAAGLLRLVFARQLWSSRMQQHWSRVSAWIHLHPRRVLLLVAAISTIISCYPVVFFGRSYVGANIVPMLYASAPTLPGSEDLETEDFRGADTGAMMWQNLPYSVVQSRALARYAELPLWNRYNSCGTILLGQGLSMFGDPLHLITLAGGGAGWAWDIKFLVAKVLFCWALGLLVLVSARHFPSALLLACSSAFIGFFSYRFDHPAFFSMCYAPWLLLCWIEITRAATKREAARWVVALLIASWAELNSGTVKESYVLLLSLHGCGLLVFLLAAKASRARKLLDLILIGAVFALLSTPVCLTLWNALKDSYSQYKGAVAFQIQPGMLVGLFDEIFYRAVNSNASVFDPAANFFILLGCILALVYSRLLLREPIFVAVAIGALCSFALVFGVVPPALIKHIPVLKNVWHVDNTFSCVLIIELVVLAGFGFRCYWQRITRRTWKLDFVLVALVLFALFGAYMGLTDALQRRPDNFAPLGQDGLRDAFFYFYSFSLIVAALALPWLGRAIFLRSRMASLAAPLALLCIVALHWRNGFQLNTGVAPVDAYVVNPPARVDLRAPSPAIRFLKSQPGLFRTVGFGEYLFPGYNGVVDLEAICGPDPLMNPYYHELLLSAGVKLDIVWRWIVEKGNLASTLPVYNLLNVRYFLDAPQKTQGSESSLTSLTSLDLNVYRNDTAWPRAFFVDEVRTYDTTNHFLDMVRTAGGRPLAAVQNGDLSGAEPRATTAIPSESNRRVVPARDYRLTNNTTTFTVEAPSAGIAVLTEAYLAEDFIARINGVQTTYFRVNHAFRGVKIPAAGAYVISFSYWPRHFTASLWMAAAGALLLVGWMILVFRESPGASVAGQEADG